MVVTDGALDGKPELRAYVGWQSQDDLPGHIAGGRGGRPDGPQERLTDSSRGHGGGKAVVASRSASPFTIPDGDRATRDRVIGRLGNEVGVALDDRALRPSRGGRPTTVREHYAWPAIIERHYRPLFESHSADTRQDEGVSTAGPLRRTLNLSWLSSRTMSGGLDHLVRL